MTDHWDERELERLMKQGLETKARDADVDVPIADRARSAARSGRWRTTTALGLAAASVAAVAGGVALLGDDERRSGGRDVAGDPDRTPTGVDEWRTEYWHDIAVDVPDDWGWGASPMADSIGRGNGLIGCWPEAFRTADGGVPTGGSRESTPYVGRPFLLTDVCTSFDDDNWPEPTAPYLWLGTPLEPGIREFDNGFVQETIDFEGEPVTVATDDPSLREQILDSVTGGETCLSELEAPPQTRYPYIEGVEDFTSLRVCAYRRDTAGEQLRLAYAVSLPGSHAQRLVDELTQTSEDATKGACPPGNVYVQLQMQGTDANDLPEIATFVVDLGSCASIESHYGHHDLTEANVSPWAVDGLPTILFAPWAWDEPWMSDYFTGTQG